MTACGTTCRHEWVAGPYPLLVCRYCDKAIELMQEGVAR